ncbi:unnamed protein product [marine sediment metagenome]|uniref:Uncharacterized protein n=1 Tax=marine sediment metagenome TaxID=412755 RepID=X1FQE0_9ZZZZ
MDPEEFIKSMLKKAREYQRSKSQKETDEIINGISRDLYTGIKHGVLRRLVVQSLKGILSTLPDNPNERDIDITIKLIESIILTVISSILSEGRIITLTPIRNKDNKQSGDKHVI